jgi:hypothetical protein
MVSTQSFNSRNVLKPYNTCGVVCEKNEIQYLFMSPGIKTIKTPAVEREGDLGGWQRMLVRLGWAAFVCVLVVLFALGIYLFTIACPSIDEAHDTITSTREDDARVIVVVDDDANKCHALPIFFGSVLVGIPTMFAAIVIVTSIIDMRV